MLYSRRDDQGGPMTRKGRESIPDDDRTIGEISNDAGDHAVYEIPTREAKQVEGILRDAGVERDRDEALSRKDPRVAQRTVERRDSEQLRYHQDRVSDGTEDLETEVDDDSLSEPDEVSAD